MSRKHRNRKTNRVASISPVQFESMEPRLLLDSQIGTVTMPYTGYLSAGIYDSNGQLVRTLLARAPEPAGNVTLTWDGKDSFGRTVAQSGTYTWKALVSQVEATDQGGVGDSTILAGDPLADAGYSVQSVAVSTVPGMGGEAGGTFAQNDSESYFGDTSLSQSYTFSNTITASGDFYASDFNMASVYDGTRMFIGHFSSSTADNRREFMGLEFLPGVDNDRVSISARIFFPLGSPVLGASSNYLDIGRGSGLYHFTYTYDPNYEADPNHAGPEGRLSVRVYNDALTVDQTLYAVLAGSHRDYGSTFDAFGMGVETMEAWGGDKPGNTAKLAMDNVSYSGHAGVVDFNSSCNWVGSGNTTGGQNYGWTQYSNADGSLYSASYMEEKEELRKVGPDGSSRWTSVDAMNSGVAADEKYVYVTRDVNIQTNPALPPIYESRLYRYWSRDGGAAPFSPTKTYIVLNTNYADPVPSTQLSYHWTPEQWRNIWTDWGVAADGYRIWVTDYRNNRIMVYDRNATSDTPLAQYTITKPLGIAVQAASSGSATIWVANGARVGANDGSVTQLTFNGTSIVLGGKSIPNLADPTGIAIGGPNGHLFVAESGHSHIHEYDISGSTAVLAGLQTFGSKSNGGPVTDSQFNWTPWGNWASLAIDPTGILNVTDDHRIQRFYTVANPGAGIAAGDLYQSDFSEFSPTPVESYNYTADGKNYMVSGRYVYEVDPEYTGGPRKGWLGDGSWRLVERFNFGNGEENVGPGIRRMINGHELFYEIYGETVIVYTVGANGQRQAAIVAPNWTGPDRMTKTPVDTNGWAVGGRYVWTDTDGDGVVDWSGIGSGTDGEVKWSVPLGQPSGLGYCAPWVDQAGNIWMVDSNANIVKVPLDGFDAQNNPLYDWAHMQTVVPFVRDAYGFAPFTIRIGANGDIWAEGSMASMGPASKKPTYVNGGDTIARFDSTGHLLLMAPTLDYGYAGFAIDEAAAGGSQYYVTGSMSYANMFTNDGLLVDAFTAGPASGGPVGWMDQPYCMGLSTNPLTGQTYVYGEEVYYGKSARWRMDNMSTIQRSQGDFSYTAPTAMTGHFELNSNLLDSAGSNNGSFFGGSPLYPTGHVGNGLSFDGVYNYATVPYSADFTGYTISLWVKPNNNSWVNVFSRTDGGLVNTTDEIRINGNGKFEHYTLDTVAPKVVTGTTTVAPGTWYNVTITATSNGMARLYVNGVEQGTAVSIGSLWNGGDRFMLGGAAINTGSLNGMIDDVRIYESALSSSDILAIYNSTALPRVSIAASDATAAEQSTDKGTFAIRRDSSVGNLTVYYAISGAASNGTDYSSLSTSIVIPDGQTSATITVNPIDDAVADADETVILTISSNSAYAIGDANAASVKIVDNDVTSVNPAGRWAFENNLNDYIGQNPTTYWGRYYYPNPAPSDYADGLIGRAISEDGTICYVDIPYSNDATAYTISLWVKPTDTTSVNIINRGDGSDSPTTISEQIRLNANGQFEQYTYDSVAHTITGTTVAQPDVWYHVAIVGSNNGMARLYVNGQEEGSAVSLGTLWTGGDRFEVGKGTTVGGVAWYFNGLVDDLQIFDAPLTAAQIQAIYSLTCSVSVTASDANASEQGTDPGVFTITRTNTTGVLTVNYTIGGTATSGSDYTALGGSVVIANGQSSATVTVNPIDDSTAESAEAVVLTVSAGTGYSVGSPNIAAVIIADNEPTVTISASDPSAAEPNDTGTFTVTRTNSSGVLTVYYAVSGTAASGSDFSALSGSVVIANGQTSAAVTVTPIDDGNVESTETVVVTLSTNATYTIGSQNVATVNIADNEATVTIAASDASAAEPSDTGTFTVTRNNTTGNVTVYYAVSGTATSGSDFSALSGSVVIASGQTSAIIIVTPIDDSVSEVVESVTVTLSANAAYSIGSPNVANVNITDNDAVPLAVTNANFQADGGGSGYNITGWSSPSHAAVEGWLDPATVPFWNSPNGMRYSAPVAAAHGSVGTINWAQGADSAFVTQSLAATYTLGSTYTFTLDVGFGYGYNVLWGSLPGYGGVGARLALMDGSGNVLAGTSVINYSEGTFQTYSISYTATSADVGKTVVIGFAKTFPPQGAGAIDFDNAAVTVTGGQPTVSVAATDANAAEQGADPGTFTVSRTTSSGALTVYYNVSGSATSASDYSALATSVVIPNGQTSATITVTPIDDSTAEVAETVILTVSTNANYTVGTQNTAIVTIADNEPVVSIAASDPNAAEPSDTGTFIVTRTTSSGALTVYYGVSGSATSGSDFSAIGTSVVIANGQTSAAITATPIDDTANDPNETVIVTLNTNAGYTVGSPNIATVTIADNDPLITVTATDSSAAESGPDTGTFRISRNNTTNALTVYYTMSGTATSGSDYSALSGSVVIASGQSSATVTLTPIDDTVVESTETAILTVSANASYTIGSPSNATVNITNNDAVRPIVSVTATDASAAEQGQDLGTFKISRDLTSSALTVYYTMSGTATNTSDYSTLSGSVVMAAGVSSATVTVTPIDDATSESTEAAILTINSNASYDLGTPVSATVNIADNDTIVSITASDPDASESGLDRGTFTVTRTTSSGNLTVYYGVSGSTATSGSDYSALSGSVVIADTQTSATITVTPMDDTINDPNETVIATLSTGTGYTVGSPNNATVTIADDDPLITVTATDPTAAEPGADTGTFTVSRNNTTGALTVYYSISGTATSGSDFSALSGSVVIASGQSSATVTVTPINDSIAENSEAVTMTLLTNPGYTVSMPNAATVTIADDDAGTVTISNGDFANGVTGWASDGWAAGEYAWYPTAYDSGTLAAHGVVVDTYWSQGAVSPYIKQTLGSTYVPGNIYTFSMDVGFGNGYNVLWGHLPGYGGVGAILALMDTAGNVLANTRVINYSEGTFQRYSVSYTATAADAGKTIVVGFAKDFPPQGVQYIDFDNAAIAVGTASPTVNVTATDPSAAEQAVNTGTFTITRTTSTGTLTVYYAVSGTATSGTDYSALGGSVVIANGQTSATVTITPIDDTAAEADETVTLTLSTNATYTIGTNDNATVTISDNDSSSITLTNPNFTSGMTGWASDSGAALESAYNPTAYDSATRSAHGQVALIGWWQGSQSPYVKQTTAATYVAGTVYTFSIDVGFGNGYNVLYGDIPGYGGVGAVLALMDTSGAVMASTSVINYTQGTFQRYSITYTATSADAGKTIVVGFAKAFPPQGPASIDFDNAALSSSYAAPTVTVTAPDASAAEASANTGTFAITRTGTSGALTVYYTVGGSATSGSDFSALSGSVVIANGQSSATVTLMPIDDAVVDVDETVVLTLSTNQSYNIGDPDNATVMIADNDATAVTISNADFSGGITGWASTGGAALESAYNPTAYDSGTLAAHGKVALIGWWQGSDSPYVKQTLSSTYAIGNTYTFSMDVGFGTGYNVLYGAIPGYGGVGARLALMDTSGNVLASTSVISYSEGTFQRYSVTYTATANDAGKTIVVGFAKIFPPIGVASIDFDNASLVYVAPRASDTFESGNGTGGTGWSGNWAFTGSATVVGTGSPNHGSNHLQLTGNNGVASRAVNMAGVTSAHLIFDWKANLFEAGETAVVEIYNGTTWITVQTIGDGQDDNVYHHSDIDLSSYTLTSSFQVRFRSLMSDANDFFFVDDLWISR